MTIGRPVGLLENRISNNPTSLLACWGLSNPPNKQASKWRSACWAAGEVVRPARVMRRLGIHRVRDRLGIDHPIEDFDQRAAVTTDEFRDTTNGQSPRVIAQRGEDHGVQRWEPLNCTVSTMTVALLHSCGFGAVHLLPGIARRASGDQIGEVVRTSFADSEDVVNMQHDVRRDLAAVAACELIAFKNGPADGVPVIRDDAWCTHVGSVPYFQQFAHAYQSAESVG